MKEKLNLLALGSIVSVSLISPPSFLRLSFIELSDFLILLFSLLLFLDFVRTNADINKNSFQTKFWLSLIILLLISTLIYGFNAYIFRLAFYFFTGYLFTTFLIKKTIYDLQYFLAPFVLVSILNLIATIFQTSFVDNTIGWITYYYENPSFLDRGRLSGFQGSGPNVAGGMFTVLTFLTFYLYKETRNIIWLLFSLINSYLVFMSFSRGSYLSFLIGVFIIFFYFMKNFKLLFFSSISVLIGISIFLYFGDSKILLKESDRGVLTAIAVENISFFSGMGPGNYIESIYKDYFLSINPDILKENLNINLNKVELGITPIENRDSDVDFFIGTSGGGYEVLVQSRLVSECSEDRITCQHVRVKEDLLKEFFSAIFQISNLEIQNHMSTSNCFDKSNLNILRGEYFCFLNYIYNPIQNIDQVDDIPNNYMSVPCTDVEGYNCESRELAIGELAVIVEQLSIGNSIVPFDNYKKYCSECNFRNVEGYIKLKFEKRDKLLPRSNVSFYTSKDMINWDRVGYERTTGQVIDLNLNASYLEIGGHSDGQSFGNTFLDAVVKEVVIKTDNKSENILFVKKNLNNQYFVFKPSELNNYKANITFEDEGIKLFRPNKYWLAIENNFDFNQNFELILSLSLPEIPWERQTLISNTSIFNNQIQSWKLEIDDGRLFFYWADEDGVFIEKNTIGDKSLRSGVLIQENGKIANTKPPIVDPSFLSQLTTAHNGYLTFSAEFGLLISMLFYAVILYAIYRQYFLLENNDIYIFVAVMMFLLQNFTNDMVYSPDMLVLFIISLSIIFQSTTPLEDKKS